MRLPALCLLLALGACELDESDLGSTTHELAGPLPRFVATDFTITRGTSLDPFSHTFVQDGVAQRLREEVLGSGCIGDCFLVRAKWTIGGLPAVGGTHTLEIVARRGSSEGGEDTFVFTARRPDGTQIPFSCVITSSAEYQTCRAHFSRLASESFITVSVADGPMVVDHAASTLHVDHIALIPGLVPVTIQAPVSVTPGSTGKLASVVIDSSVLAYQWSLAGGQIESDPGQPQIAFGAGPPGTTMTLTVRRSYPLGDDVSTRRVQVDFLDVPPGLMPETTVYHDVTVLAGNGVTAGCGGGNFCPTGATLRDQVAIFLLRSKEGSGYTPPSATGIFADVPTSSPFAPWIEQLWRRGITSGCAVGLYCPSDGVTRAAAAIFVLRTLHGASYVPPPALGIFEDVPSTDPAAPFIEEAYRRDLFTPCNDVPLQFCPSVAITRASMSTALVRGFGLRFP